jgi:uncharacterized protein (DUF2267 family)
MTGVDVFETTVQKTYEWLHDLMLLLHWEDRHRAYLALRATLQALRDRLPIEIAVKLSAQLPMLIRGFYYEGWKPAITPIKVKNTEEFLVLVSLYCNNANLSQEEDIEKIVRAVFQVVASHVSSGEIHHIKQALPIPIANLWPSTEYSTGKRR